jgi:hypothetical protein
VLFADTEGISKKYKMAAKAGEDLLAFATGDIDPATSDWLGSNAELAND